MTKPCLPAFLFVILLLCIYFPETCLLCPSKVGPGSQIYVWRQSLEKLGKANPVKKAMSNGMKYLFERPALYTTALKFAPLVNLIPECCTHFSNWNAWGIGHTMPEFAKKSFHQLWKEGKVK